MKLTDLLKKDPPEKKKVPAAIARNDRPNIRLADLVNEAKAISTFVDPGMTREEFIKKHGVPPDRMSARNVVSYILSRNAAPRGYTFSEFASGFLRGGGKKAAAKDPVRADSWRFYLGLPQYFGSIEDSPYKPSVSSDPGAHYYRLADGEEERESALMSLYMNPEKDRARFHTKELGLATAGWGEDDRGKYFSIYDLWDLQPPALPSAGKIAGMPFEIYDRIYYDADTEQMRSLVMKADSVRKAHGGSIFNAPESAQNEFYRYVSSADSIRKQVLKTWRH